MTSCDPGMDLRCVSPYSSDGRWVFNDPRLGLVGQPFSSQVNAMLDRLTAGIRGARRGFRLIFSDHWFPCAQVTLQWQRKAGGRNWYRWDEKHIEGWFDSTLLAFFDKPPSTIHIKAEPRWTRLQHLLMDRVRELVDTDNRGAWLMRQLQRYAPIKIPIAATGRWNILLLPDMPVDRLIVAHYDRVDGSPGANDNSAACIELLTAVENCWSRACTTAVCFTDLEETQNCAKFGMEPPAGAQALVKWLSGYSHGAPRQTLVFDICGIGPVLSVSRPLPGDIVRLVPGRMRLDVQPDLQSDNQAIPDSTLLVSFPETIEDAVVVQLMMHTTDDVTALLEAETIAAMTEFMSRLIDNAGLDTGLKSIRRRRT